MELVPGVGRCHLRLVGRPEPAVDKQGLELGLVAAVEVALPPRGPEESGAAQEALHPVVLLLRLEGHQVHAPLPEGTHITFL